MDLDRMIGQGLVGWVVMAVALASAAGALLAAPAALWRPRRIPEPLHFTPQPAPLALFIGIAAGSGVSASVAAIWLGHWQGLLLAPGIVVASVFLTRWVARWWYRRQLQRQVSSALVQLTALVAGSSSLLSAFRSVAEGSRWPLAAEWQWAEQQTRTPIVVRERGRTTVRYVDHAMAIAALSQQTWDPIHAQALLHLANIYDSGAEAHALPRLRALTEAVMHMERTRRDAHRHIERVIAQSYLLVGAMLLVAGWLLVSQPERMGLAFGAGPLGIAAALWFGIWLGAPLLAARWLTRVPDWPF